MAKVAGEIIADPSKSFQIEKYDHPLPTTSPKPETDPPKHGTDPPSDVDLPKEPLMDPLTKTSTPKPQPQIPGFSGLNNCQITFNFQY